MLFNITKYIISDNRINIMLLDHDLMEFIKENSSICIFYADFFYLDIDDGDVIRELQKECVFHWTVDSLIITYLHATQELLMTNHLWIEIRNLEKAMMFKLRFI